MKLNIRFLSKDDCQIAESVLKSAGWDCAGTGAYLAVDLSERSEVDTILYRLETAQIEWRVWDWSR